MLIGSILNSWRPTPGAIPTGTGTGPSGGTTPSGGSSETATPAPTSTTPPSEPPQSAQPVQPTNPAPTTGTATSGAGEQPTSAQPVAEEAPTSVAKPIVAYSEPAEAEPRTGDGALRQYKVQLSSGAFRPLEPAGTIEAEVRRIETVESAQITRAELIKQASVAMLAQANLRRQDVLEILRA